MKGLCQKNYPSAEKNYDDNFHETAKRQLKEETSISQENISSSLSLGARSEYSMTNDPHYQTVVEDRLFVVQKSDVKPGSDLDK